MNGGSSRVPASSRQENVWLNLLCNAVLPGFFLTFLSKEQRLGPVWGLVVSLSIPLAYGIWDLWTWRRLNIVAVIGVVGTLLTGVLGLFKSDGFWIAFKEAAVPTVLGLAIPLSLRTTQPLVRTLLYNDQILNTSRIQAALEARANVGAFEKLLVWVSWVLASSFLLSAVLNYYLARWLLTAPPGTPQFNDQLGKMNWLSWPIIALPSTAVTFLALFKLLRGLEQLTGLNGQDFFHRASKNVLAAAESPDRRS